MARNKVVYLQNAHKSTGTILDHIAVEKITNYPIRCSEFHILQNLSAEDQHHV